MNYCFDQNIYNLTALQNKIKAFYRYIAVLLFLIIFRKGIMYYIVRWNKLDILSASIGISRRIHPVIEYFPYPFENFHAIIIVISIILAVITAALYISLRKKCVCRNCKAKPSFDEILKADHFVCPHCGNTKF